MQTVPGGARVGSGGADRDRPGKPAPGLWSFAVPLGHVVDGEAGAFYQDHRVPGEVAAVGQPALQGLKAVLPCRHTWIGGQAVLEEVKPAPGADDAPDL